MNYNNFSCRVTPVRSINVAHPEVPPKPVVRKVRKGTRRRSVAVVATMVLLAGAALWAGTPTLRAAETLPDTPRIVPASGTVAFTRMTGRLTLDKPFEKTPEEDDLAARVEAFTEQVNALTAQSFPVVRPPDSAQLSGLTGILLCAGLAVAIFRAGSLFQPDLAC